MAYNHAPFIRKCLDGFLMQEPPTGVSVDEVWYEILIHDDCSTDGTDDIIREYTEKYPDKIFPLYEEENQYSKGKVIDAFNYDRAKGRYIAVCEGDDYWTDPKKLQKQVDWMDAHPEYSACFHRVIHHNVYTGEDKEDKCFQILNGVDGVDIDMSTYFAGWYTQPLSMIFRTSMFDFSILRTYKYYRDMQEIYHLLKNGKGYLFAFIGGVRNIHEGGIASMISDEKYCEVSLPMDGEFFWKTLDFGWPRKNYIATLDASVRVYAKINKSKALRCAIIRFLISGWYKTFFRQLKLIFTSKKK